MSVFKAGILALTTLLLLAYFGFTKANPFANPYELKAMFRDVESLKPRSPVRIAGVEVGQGHEGRAEGRRRRGRGDDGAARTTRCRSARTRAPRSARASSSRATSSWTSSPARRRPASSRTARRIPITQTAATVTLPDILDTLDSDVRGDLQTFLHEYGTVALQGGGAKAFNRAIPSFEPAYRYGALTNDALLGVDPDHDMQRLLKGQQKTFAALGDNPEALKELVTDLNTTAGAIASQDAALEASVPALRDTLRVGSPALAALNDALPTLRTFSREALPGVRSTVPALAAATPWFDAGTRPRAAERAEGPRRRPAAGGARAS